MFNETSLTSPMTENRVPSSQIRQERARSQNYTSRGILHEQHSQLSEDRYDGKCGTPGCVVRAVNGRHAGFHTFADGSKMLA